MKCALSGYSSESRGRMPSSNPFFARPRRTRGRLSRDASRNCRVQAIDDLDDAGAQQRCGHVAASDGGFELLASRVEVVLDRAQFGLAHAADVVVGCVGDLVLEQLDARVMGGVERGELALDVATRPVDVRGPRIGPGSGSAAHRVRAAAFTSAAAVESDASTQEARNLGRESLIGCGDDDLEVVTRTRVGPGMDRYRVQPGRHRVDVTRKATLDSAANASWLAAAARTSSCTGESSSTSSLSAWLGSKVSRRDCSVPPEPASVPTARCCPGRPASRSSARADANFLAGPEERDRAVEQRVRSLVALVEQVALDESSQLVGREPGAGGLLDALLVELLEGQAEQRALAFLEFLLLLDAADLVVGQLLEPLLALGVAEGEVFADLADLAGEFAEDRLAAAERPTEDADSRQGIGRR